MGGRMFTTYFKLAYRNLLKNKLSSIINITGLSVAIGCSIVFFLLLDKEYTSDRFHEKAENIFLVVYTLEGDDRARRWGDSPLPLGPALEAEIPQIERAVRVLDKSATVHLQSHVFRESIRFVDQGFMDMFSFPLKQGRKDALFEKNSLILSVEMAEKYFGTKDPIGQQIIISLGKEQQASYFVQGVAEKFPHNASFAFDILASLDNLRDSGIFNEDQWDRYARATFVQLKNLDQIQTVSAQMDRYIRRHNTDNIDRSIASFAFEPLPTLSWESQEIERSISSGSTPQALILLFVIGLFLLIQACFNYVNIALGSSARRLKEIGIRKVVGCQRAQLIYQFLGENVLMCFLSLIGGLLLTEFLLLPGLMSIEQTAERFSLTVFFSSSHLWIYLILVLIITGIGAGAYPAFVITRLQPINIMKNKFKLAGKKRFTSALLTFQFGIAFVILCLVTAFMQNNRYQQERDWGYRQEHVFNIQLEDAAQFPILRNESQLHPDILQTSGSAFVIGRSKDQAVVEVAAEKYEVIRFDVGLHYLETIGVRLKEGRFFREDLSTDLESSLIVNARFVHDMGWRQAVDKSVRFDDKLFNIIGVVEDFHYDFFWEEIQPVILRLIPEESYNTMTVRINAGTGVKTAESLRSSWRRLFPDSLYTAFFQDVVFEDGYRNSLIITRIFTATAIITLIISCMGLFGLVTFMISKRMKEFSIHKVLGASQPQLSFLIVKKYLVLLTLAVFLALPLSYFTIHGILGGVYRYHMPLGPLPFFLSGIVVIFTAALTIASQVYRAAVRDPIEAIRYE
jgi:ABC-type antimicrobial peptide transport system permease subunit